MTLVGRPAQNHPQQVGTRGAMSEVSMTSFPTSIEQALRTTTDIPPRWREDDDLADARADYRAYESMWRQMNGREGGMEAFARAVIAARRLRDLEAVVA